VRIFASYAEKQTIFQDFSFQLSTSTADTLNGLQNEEGEQLIDYFAHPITFKTIFLASNHE